MTQSFAETVPQLCGLSAQFLRWRPDDFWSSTPDELAMALHNPNSEPTASFDRAQLNTLMKADSDGR